MRLQTVVLRACIAMIWDQLECSPWVTIGVDETAEDIVMMSCGDSQQDSEDGVDMELMPNVKSFPILPAQMFGSELARWFKNLGVSDEGTEQAVRLIAQSLSDALGKS